MTTLTLLLAALLAMLAPVSVPNAVAELDEDTPTKSTPATDETEDDDSEDLDLPIVATRQLAVDTSEGTWISLDVSPDGKTVAFDLLGDLYTVSIGGGNATRLTHGLAFDSQPRFDPAGEKLLFTSDRDGGENLWTLSLANGDTTQVTKGKKNRYQSPEYTPDGKYIVASRTGNRFGRPKLWMWHVDGGSGAKLIKEPDNLKTTGAAFGSDPRYIWFAQRTGGWQYNAQLPQYQLAVYDRQEGTSTSRTSRYGSAFRPTLSPDGKWLVYGTRHDEHTGLVLRELATGDERWLAYPVQHDAQEGRATRDVIPGMSFTPDSRELVASYGGKIWRIPIDGSDPIAIPFRVQSTVGLGPRLEFEYPIADDPRLVVRQVRDARPSPDGTRLVFTALDRLWIMDYPDGQPQRLTNSEETEQQPTWSPDGKQIVYVTWAIEGGHIKQVRARGNSRPRVLTQVAAVYRSPVVSPDGDRVVAMRAPRRALQEATGPLYGNATTDLVWIPTKGGDVTVIAPSAGRRAPHFSNTAERIYLYHGERGLVSLKWDGTDERGHLKVTGGKLPDQEDPFEPSVIYMAPDEEHALAILSHQAYVVTVPYLGGSTPIVSVSKPDDSSFPVRKLTRVGSQFAGWSADAQSVFWSMGNAYVRYDLVQAKAVEDEAEALRKEREAQKKLEKEREDANGGDQNNDENADKDDAETDDSADDDDKDEEDDLPEYEPQEIRIELTAPRDIPQGTLALSGARLITMNGTEVIESGNLIIENNRIVSVNGTIPEGAEVRDVSGFTIVPGFVDTHAHLRPAWGIHKGQPWQYLANLAFGVTTTRDPQTGTTDVLSYSDLVDTGAMLGPRIYSTGPGVFWDEALDDLDEARNVLRRYSDYYDTKTIKMYVAGNRQQRQWILMAARELQIMPTTEGSLNMKLNLTQLLDGYPGHEHNYPIFPIYRDVLDLTAFSQMTYTPTLLVAYGGPFGENYWYTTEEVHDDPRLRRFMPHAQVDARSLRRPWFHKEQHVFAEQGEFVRDLVEAGGSLGVGSHGQLQGLGYHWELWSMAAGGASNLDMLRIATVLGAKGIGLAGDLGSLEPGKLADLVILAGNPLEDIRNTNSAKWVVKNGRMYEADSLDEVWPRDQPLNRNHWWAPEPQTAAGIREPGIR